MRIVPAVLGLMLLAPAALTAQAPTTPAPAYVVGYAKPPLVTLGVAAAVAADPVALRRAAEAACAGARPCAARIWVGQGQRFRTMSDAEVRSMVASYVVAAEGATRFVCGPAGAAPKTCGARAAQAGSVPRRPAI